jgi:hypothetical protein
MKSMSDIGNRELDRRKADGIEVALLWNPRTNALVVEVDDELAGERFRIPVAPADALEAFRHPYAYAGPHDDVPLAA